MTQIQKTQIQQAREGDAKVLDALVRGIQDRVYHLSLRMLADPGAAQDATQEILIRIVTKLSTYRGDSAFTTWVTRVATNYLLTARKIRARDPGLSFPMFADDLLNGLADDTTAAPEDHVLLGELRLRCTMAMLLCLDPDHRAAYVLGEVLEFDHVEAADALDITRDNFRKRLSRARLSVQDFTAATCGLANQAAPCTCRKRLPAAMAAGRVGPEVTPELAHAPSHAAVQRLAAKTEAKLVAAKLQRATGPVTAPRDFATEVLRIVIPPG